MDAKTFSSSYSFKPRPPEKWLSKRHSRTDRKVDNIILRRWQNEAHLSLRDSVKGFIKAFCGSGKTIASRSIAAYKIYKYGKMQVFCVPKNDIGNDGFSGYFNIQIPGQDKEEKTLKCHSPVNFCNFKVVQKTDELIRVMINDSDNDYELEQDQIVSKKQIVCTHQCLVAAFKKIKKMARKDDGILLKFIQNKTFWIDEGHHIKSAATKEEERCINYLGGFVKFILDNKKTGSEIFAMTATPFRADGSNLFPSNQIDEFDLYSLDFLEHFKTLGIKNVYVDFEEWKTPEEMFKKVSQNIAKEIKCNKHIVIVPRTGSKWRIRKEDVYKLFDAIYKAIMKELGVDLSTAKSMVLDLVTENTQEKNAEELRKEPKSGQSHPSKYSVVVACGMLREGTDWVPADRLHNTAVEDSPTLGFQTGGRLFRENPGKESVRITYYPEQFSIKLYKKGGKREFIADRLNCMLHYMLFDDLLNPIMVEIPCFYPLKKKEKSEVKRKYTTLEDHFGLKYSFVKKELLDAFSEKDFNESNADQVINKIINKHLPNKSSYSKKYITEIKLALKTFLLRAASQNLRNKGIDISYVRKNGFDIIVEKEKISGNIYTSTLTADEMERFREVSKLGSWDDETNKRRLIFLKKKAEKQLGRKIIEKNGVIKDQEALIIITSKFREQRKLHDCILNLNKKSKNFSVQDVAKSLNVSKQSIIEKVKEFNNFLPRDWKQTLSHSSWHSIA